jgi:hypothetical protein
MNDGKPEDSSVGFVDYLRVARYSFGTGNFGLTSDSAIYLAENHRQLKRSCNKVNAFSRLATPGL